MNKSLKTFGYGQLKTDPCNVTINLPYFENENGNSLGGQQLFFLETSGARGLSGRQVCSVESAALHSQIGRIHLLFKSTQIDLNKRKSMCELGKETNGKTERAEIHGETHYSSIGRLALLYKYGGFYLDLDVVILKSLENMNNVFALEPDRPLHYKLEQDRCKMKPAVQTGVADINNGHFHLSKGHQLLWAAMDYVNKSYNPVTRIRGEAGPGVMGKVARKFYGYDKLSNIKLKFQNDQKDIEFLHSWVFTPVNWRDARQRLWLGKGGNSTPEEWEELSRCCHGIHFYSNRTKQFKVTGNVKRESYSYFGPKFCPKAFKDLENF
ncbi:lactosylceramide 4-alpha-galactosyltransferase-like [Convolutriloba macropyga]|uniref:lactosylceramide 4-alpha-galactosyltransferase-like n=1 Tax=Convolutriloba macropyga TaxID=536237 RepID=UPI003F527C94